MQTTSEFKGIKLTNIPFHGLRTHFYNNYHMIVSEEFQSGLKKWNPYTEINTPYLAWHTWPEMFCTYLCQTTITGMESYIGAAVYFELGKMGQLKENIEFIRNPFSLKSGRGTAEKIFDGLPSLVSNELKLSVSNPELWSEVKLFYKHFRNPIFHGEQLEGADPLEMKLIFEFIADVYEWVDAWHDPGSIIPGAEWVTQLNRT